MMTILPQFINLKRYSDLCYNKRVLCMLNCIYSVLRLGVPTTTIYYMHVQGLDFVLSIPASERMFVIEAVSYGAVLRGDVLAKHAENTKTCKIMKIKHKHALLLKYY